MGNNKYIGIAKSVLGSSHKKIEKECQDSSGYFEGARYSAAIVSDGHGGDKHFRSSTGSSIIKEVLENSLPDFIKSVYRKIEIRDVGDVFKWYIKYLIFAWRDEIESELIMNPIEDDEKLTTLSAKDADEVVNNPHIAYGATMILAIYCRGFCYIAQLGDGDIRILTRNGIENPLEEDESLKFGRTTSLCNSDAFSHVRYIVLPANAVKGCFISSDGVRNSFDSEENFDKFAKVILDQLVEPGNALQGDLEDFLSRLSSEGSGDDVSVAAMIRKR